MQLKLTRSQRESGIVSKAIVFCLDARVQLTAEEQANVSRYRLGSQVIYNSEASKRHLDKAQVAQSTSSAGGIAKSFLSLAMAALNLNITINGLQRGQHIECKSLDELLAAEDALMEACKNLRSYLDTAATFDGREVLFSFDGGEPVIVSSAPPPMLAAPGAVMEAPDASPPEFDAAEASGSPLAAALPFGSRHGDEPDEGSFEEVLDRIRGFWIGATQGQKMLVIGGGVVVLLLVFRAFA